TPWNDLVGDWKEDRTLPDGEIRLTRPGKDSDTSATIGHDGRDVFHIFTSNGPPFVQHANYNKCQVYALLHHNGDSAAAAADLSAQGYGTYLDWDGTEKPNPPPKDWAKRKPQAQPSVSKKPDEEEVDYSTLTDADLGRIKADAVEEGPIQ